MTATAAAARRDRPVQTGPCPVCDGTTRALFTVHGHTIRHCPHCDHRFAADAVRPDHVATSRHGISWSLSRESKG